MSRWLSNFSLIVSSTKAERQGSPCSPAHPVGQQVPVLSKPRAYSPQNPDAGNSLLPRPRHHYPFSPRAMPLLDDPSSGALPTHRGEHVGLRQTGRLAERDRYTDIMSVFYYSGIHQAPTCAGHSDRRIFQELPGFGDAWKSETEHSHSELCDLEQVT